MKNRVPLTELPKGISKGFLGFPFNLDLENLDAQIAILGVPYGLPYYPNELANDQSTAPDLLRQNAQDAAWDEPRTTNHFDWDLGGSLLDNKNIKIIDLGNVTADFRNPREHYKRAEEVARKVFSSNTTLISIGGDHGIPIPIMRALPEGNPVVLIQIDAHMDWRDEVNGEKEGYSSPIRRASEKNYVSGITQIGIRNVSSTAKEGYIDAKNNGSKIFSVRDLRRIGNKNILNEIPKNKNYYITIDIDAFDPSIAAGTGTPSHGGFYYYEILELLDGIIKQGTVVGLDLVEVAPDYDQTNSTSTLAAQILMNTIGRILHYKKK